MDISKMLAELRSERDQVVHAILALERIALGSGKRRGRPPKWLSEASTPTTESAGPAAKKPRKKRVVNAESKRRMAEAQKKRWAAKRKADKLEAAQ